MKISPRIGLSGFFTPLVVDQLVLVGALEYENSIRRFDVPTAQVEFGHCHKSLHRVFNLGNWKHGLGMSHEAASYVSDLIPIECFPGSTHFVMRSNMDRGSRMKVGRVTRLRSAPGRNCEMM